MADSLLRGARMDNWTLGDSGGALAGLVAVLAVLGKALAWLLNWNDARTNGRETRLAAWEKNLASRERLYREEIEGQLAATRNELHRVEAEIGLVRSVLSEVTAELHRHAPGSPALARAARVLGGSD